MLDFLGQFEAVGAWNLVEVHSKKEKPFSSSKAAMDFVDTSLDLNSKPLRLIDETPTKEVQSKFFDFEKKLSVKDETGALVEELNRVSAENKKLSEMLTVMCESYNSLRGQMVDYMSKSQPEKELSPSKKRKSESSNNTSANIVPNNNNNNINININNNGNSESSSTDEESFKRPRLEDPIKTKIWKTYVKTEQSDSTSLIVKDGYQWRKYGQKVTRDNPSPRAYFKCSFAPSCPVKKKVQRSVEDQTVLVATYEGEHNHPRPSQAEATSGSNRTMTNSVATSSPNAALDFAKQKSNSGEVKPAKMPRVDSPDVRQFLVEQMASSLTKDPNFTAALAAAISGRIYEQRNPTEKW